MITKKTSLTLLISSLLLIILVLYLSKPIPQSPNYHQFADQRSLQEIPNAANVLSNIAIAIPGFWGLFLLLSSKVHFNNPLERGPWLGVSLGLILTAAASSYYHWAPDNARLVWDRLAMMTIFMSLLAALITERINTYLGLGLWPFLLAIGFYSVLAWYVSEQHGHSDLRFYIGVQAFTIVTALIMLFSLSPYDRSSYLALAIICYGLAVLFDRYDHEIYALTNRIISGHTLKHVAVGLTGACLIELIWKRKKEISV